MNDGIYVRVDGQAAQLVVSGDGCEVSVVLSPQTLARLIEHLALTQSLLADVVE